MAEAITLFDLDNTLLAGDSDHLWGEYLVEQGVVDETRFRNANDRFYAAYQAGTLDIDEFLRFALRPLAETPPERLLRLREAFIRERIAPIVLPAGRTLVESHRERGDTLVIITATNRFITGPIAELLGVEHLLATEPEHHDGRFTGGYTGTPTYREGKIVVFGQWRRERGLEEAATTFYSDSHNDLPLLREVNEPVAVDPDPELDAAAQRNRWPRITLRKGERPQPLP
ncbi:HAD family hydrolase [Arhodomonas sp. SL1]|uniref:histidinol-phosphatase n=1 Tax=Arhodomonas sp. SL1 TaxID=3425691 RepID=UPI003F8855B7